MTRNFRTLLADRWERGFFLCVGLDSDYTHDRFPAHLKKPNAHHEQVAEAIVEFNRWIIDATRWYVCAYKINVAFYERYGGPGILAMWETICHARENCPQVPIILDAKRADIGNTNKGYVDFAFDLLEADAITVHPYLGREALMPFLECSDKGIFVLCRTSNPGAGEFQDFTNEKGERLYQRVARRVADTWNTMFNCGLVVGATYPDELATVRGLVEEMPILIPGIGAQGGDLKKVVQAGKTSSGKGMIINSSRGTILSAPASDRHFGDAAGEAAKSLHEQIQNCLKEG